jgi:hypothetical protein
MLYVEWYDCRRILPTLKKMLGSSDMNDQLVAAQTLMIECRDKSYLSMPTETLVRILDTNAADRLSDEHEWPVYHMLVVEIMAEKGDKGAIPALERYLRETDYSIIVAQAIAKLGDRSGYEMAIAARHRELRKEDGSLDLSVVDDLIRLRDKAVFRELNRELYDLMCAVQPDCDRLAALAEQVARARNETAVRALTDLFNSIKAEPVRKAVIDALKSISSPEAKEALKSLLYK